MLGLNGAEVLEEFLPLDILPAQLRPSRGNIPYGPASKIRNGYGKINVDRTTILVQYAGIQKSLQR